MDNRPRVTHYYRCPFCGGIDPEEGKLDKCRACETQMVPWYARIGADTNEQDNQQEAN